MSRTAAEIEEELAKLRESLTYDVDELTTRLNPKTQLTNATSKVQAFASTTTDKAKVIAEDAKSGDVQAIGILAGAAVAIVGFVALLATKGRR